MKIIVALQEKEAMLKIINSLNSMSGEKQLKLEDMTGGEKIGTFIETKDDIEGDLVIDINPEFTADFMEAYAEIFEDCIPIAMMFKVLMKKWMKTFDSLVQKWDKKKEPAVE